MIAEFRFGRTERSLRLLNNGEFNAVERSETHRVNSSARPSITQDACLWHDERGASRLLTAPGRTLVWQLGENKTDICSSLRINS